MPDILFSWIEAQKHVPLCSGVVLVVIADQQFCGGREGRAGKLYVVKNLIGQRRRVVKTVDVLRKN